jgi:hypothetical protein
VRSWPGRGGGWFRHALASRAGRIHAHDLDRDVVFVAADNPPHDAIDAAYRSRYAGYGAQYVDPMTGPDAAAATLRLEPGDI